MTQNRLYRIFWKMSVFFTQTWPTNASNTSLLTYQYTKQALLINNISAKFCFQGAVSYWFVRVVSLYNITKTGFKKLKFWPRMGDRTVATHFFLGRSHPLWKIKINKNICPRYQFWVKSSRTKNIARQAQFSNEGVPLIKCPFYT